MLLTGGIARETAGESSLVPVFKDGVVGGSGTLKIGSLGEIVTASNRVFDVASSDLVVCCDIENMPRDKTVRFASINDHLKDLT